VSRGVIRSSLRKHVIIFSHRLTVLADQAGRASLAPATAPNAFDGRDGCFRLGSERQITRENRLGSAPVGSCASRAVSPHLTRPHDCDTNLSWPEQSTAT
jgi:hypothetical protein